MKTTTQTIVGRIAQVGLLACFASTCLFVSNSTAQNFPFDYKVEESSSEDSGKQDVDVAQQEQDKRQDAEDGLKYHFVHDTETGMVMLRMPLPVDWHFNPDKEAEFPYTAPNNVVVRKPVVENFAFATDRFAMDSLKQVMQFSDDYKIAPVGSFEEIVAYMEKQIPGRTLLDTYELPGLDRFWARWEKGFLKNTGTQRTYNNLGTEWKDDRGNRFFVMLNQQVLVKGSTITWHLTTVELAAPEAHFEEAKEAYIRSQVETQISMEYQRHLNHKLLRALKKIDDRYRTMSESSRLAHESRMRSIVAAGANAGQSLGFGAKIELCKVWLRLDALSAFVSYDVNA